MGKIDNGKELLYMMASFRASVLFGGPTRAALGGKEEARICTIGI